MKPSAFAFTFLAGLTAAASPAFAYPPPCQAGDVYVGAAVDAEAECIDRRQLKPEKALELQGNPTASRTFIAPTRRTMEQRVRKIYLHPTTFRATHTGMIKERNVKTRRVPVRARVIEHSFRPSAAERNMTPGEKHLDLRPWARKTPRSKQEGEKEKYRENPRLKTKKTW